MAESIMTVEDARRLLERIHAESPAQLLAASNSVALTALGAANAGLAQIAALQASVDKVAKVLAIFAPTLRATLDQQAAAQESADNLAGERAAASESTSVADKPAVPRKGRSGPPGSPSPSAPNGTAPPMVPTPPSQVVAAENAEAGK